VDAADFRRHLGIIQEEDPDPFLKTWENSARWFFQETVKGRDISKAVDALSQLYLEATQVGAMRAAAAAVAAHDLKRGDVSHLRSLFAKAKYKDWIVEGIEDAVGTGLGLAPAVELLTEYVAASEYRIGALLLAHAKRGGGFLEQARRLANEPQLRDFLRSAHDKGIDISPALPLLAGHLSTKMARSSATTFRWLVELGADLSTVTPQLEKACGHDDEDIVFEAAYSLAFHHASRLAWPRVDALLTHGRPKVRWAAARALRVALLTDRRGGPEILSRIALGLLDENADTRARSLEALKEAKHKSLKVVPPADVVARLVRELDGPFGAGIAEYLHEARPEGLDALLARSGSELARRLMGATAACPTCTRLPRSGSWSSASDLPPEINALETEGALRRCPSCGRRYTLSYEDEWDDMSHYETWTFARLTPPRTRDALQGDARAAFESGYDAWIERLRAELSHPRHEVREQAAIDIAAHLVSRSEWRELAGLATLLEDTALSGVLKSLRQDGTDMSELADLLRSSTSSASGDVRREAALALAAWAVKRGRLEDLRRLLDADDTETLVATLDTVRSIETFDASTLAGRLAVLRCHRTDDVVRRASWLLTEIAKKTPAIDPLPAYLEDLASGDTKRQESAGWEIRSFVSRPEARAALPHLVSMLRRQETRFRALEGLKSFAAAGVKLAEALPALVEQAVDRTSSLRSDIVYFLQQLARQGADLRPHLAALSALLSSGDSTLRSASLQLLDDHAASGGSLAPAEPALRALLDDGEAYLREQAAKLLAAQNVRDRNVEGLRGLLRHQRSEAHYMTADVLRSTKFDLAPLLDDLLGHAQDKKQITRDYVKSAVEDWKQRSG
jgi:hypothetical protein